MFLRYDVGEGKIPYKIGKVGVVDTEDSVIESVSPVFLQKFSKDNGTQSVVEIQGSPFSFEFRLAAINVQLTKYNLLNKPYQFYQYSTKKATNKGIIPDYVLERFSEIKVSSADVSANRPLLTFVDSFENEKVIRVPWGIDVMILTKPAPNAEMLSMPATVKYFNVNQFNRTMLPNVTKVEFDDGNLKVYGTRLNRGAFGNMANLKTVTLSNTVKSIPPYCFVNCGNLVNVKMSDSLQTIGTSAFAGCNSLSELILPKYLTKIGTNFIVYTNITKMQLPDALVEFYGAFEGSTIRYLSMSEPTFYAYYDKYFEKGSKPNSMQLFPVTLRSLDVRKATPETEKAWGKTQMPVRASSLIQLSRLVNMCQLDCISAPSSFIDANMFDSDSQYLFNNGVFRWRNNEG